MTKYPGNRGSNWNGSENMQTISEYLVSLKAYKQMVTMESSDSSTPTGEPSKYDVLRKLTFPTKKTDDMMRSFEVSRQLGGLKRLERTSNNKFHHTGQTIRFITQSDAIQEALSLTRKDLPGIHKSEISIMPSVSQTENEMPLLNPGQFSGVPDTDARSRGRSKTKKYGTNLENVGNTKSKTIKEIRISPPPQIDFTIPQIRRIMEARRRAHTKKLNKTNHNCPSSKSETGETLPSHSKIPQQIIPVQKDASSLESRPPWDPSCAPIRPPKPVLLQPYFRSLFLTDGFEGIPLNPLARQTGIMCNPPNEGPNNSGDLTPKSWDYPRNITNSCEESTTNSYSSNTTGQISAQSSSSPCDDGYVESMEHERRVFGFPNFAEKSEDEIHQSSKYPIWPGGFVDKFGGKVPATTRAPQAKSRNKSGDKVYRSKPKIHRLIPVRGITFDRPKLIPQTVHYRVSGDTISKSGHDPNSTLAVTKRNVCNNSYNFMMRRNKGSNKVPQVNEKSQRIQPEEITCNTLYPTKTSLTKRISQTAVTQFKQLSGSKSSLEKIEDSCPSPSPPPLPRTRRKRTTTKEAIENSERTPLTIRFESNTIPILEPSSQRPTTGKMVERVEESLNLTKKCTKVVLREGDPDVETIYAAPDTGTFKTLFSKDYLIKSKNPIPVKNSSLKNKKSMAHRLWEGIKSVGSKESRVFPIK